MKIQLANDPEQGGAPAGQDDSGSGGGDVFAEVGGAGQGNEGQAPVAGTPATPPASLTAEDIAAAIKSAGLGQPAAQAAPATQYTQADFDKAFNVWNPDAALIAQLRGEGDAPLKAILAMREGLVRQAVTMASYIVKQAEEKFQQQMEPIHSDFTQRQIEKAYGDFFKTNEDLKPYESVCQAVVAQMQSEKLNFVDKPAAFKALAERVRSVVKNLPGGNGALPTTPGGNGSPSPTRMPPLSRGGQGGLGKGPTGSGDGKKDPSHAVFG